MYNLTPPRPGTPWTEEDFDKKAMASVIRRMNSKARTEGFFAKRDRAPRSIGWLRIMAAKMDHEGPEPVWDRMEQDYALIQTEIDTCIARIQERTDERIQEGEDTLDFIAIGEVA